MDSLRPLVVDTGRNPFELCCLALAVVTGAAGLLAPDQVRSVVIDVLPRWAGVLWYGALLLASAAGLAAVLALQLPRNLLVERAAMWTLGGLLGGYAIAVVLLTAALPVSALNLIGAAIAAGLRAWHIARRDLPRLRAALAILHTKPR